MCSLLAHSAGVSWLGRAASWPRLLVVGLIVALVPAARAQPAAGLDPGKRLRQYIHESWQTEHGLPQSTVTSIAQTPDGYLWSGSQLGLTRFDGVAFTTFTTRNAPGLTDVHISALHVDRAGALWVGTSIGGIGTFKNGRFTAIPEDTPASSVSTIYQDRAGAMWAGKSTGLMKLVKGQFRAVAGVASAVNALAEDRNGALLVGTDSGLFHQVSNGWRPWQRGISTFVGGLLLDRQGAVWIGLDGELVRVDANGVTRFTTDHGVPKGQVVELAQDRAGSLWIGSVGGGVTRHRDGRFETYSADDGLIGTDPSSIMEDIEGSLWVGTTSGGLNRFRNSAFATYGKRDGLPVDLLWSVYGDRDGSILVAPMRAALARFADGKFTSHAADAFPGTDARTMLRTSTGDLWVGTAQGVFRQPPDGRWQAMTGDGGAPAGRTRSLLEDRSGRIWIGGTYGIARYEGGKFHLMTTEAGIKRAAVWSMVQDAQGAVWFGTIGEGLFRLAGGTFTSFTMKDGLSHDVIEALYANRDGVWVGSKLGALDLVRNGKVSTIPTAGVSMVDLLSMLEDRRGRLWLSSSQGLFSAPRTQLLEAADGKRSTVDFRHYDMLDGLRGTEFNAAGNNSAWQSADGRHWYPTTKGIIVVDPNAQATNTVPPQVHIEKLVVDGRDVPYGDDIEIPRHGSKIEIRYTATSLLIPARVNFRFKLEGYDNDWVEAGTRRVAYYTGMRPGRYTFRVIAANNDGVWNLGGASIAVRKPPRFFETLWFYLLCGVAVTGAAIGLFRLRMRHTLRQARHLTTLVDERTSELRSSEERYRRMFDANPQPLWVHDAETHRFLAVNQAAIRHYGYTDAEFRAMSVADVVCAVPMDETHAATTESWRDRPIRHDRKKDGGIIEVEVDEHPIAFDGRGALLTVISDVTARRDLEERLRQAQKMEAVGQLAGGIAHDLNNVLTAVMAHVDLAVTDLPPDSMSVTDLTQAQSAAHRGAGMIRKLLGFSRRERLVLRPLDLGALATDLGATVTRMLPSHIEVKVTQSESVPPVAADAGALQQIVLNLATNARDAMKDGGTLEINVTSTILDDARIASLEVGKAGLYVVLSVTDSGAGMPPETLARVFEPYYSTKAEGEGSGLGMAMVYGLVKQHLGYVRVESQPGLGTTVSLYFPARFEPLPAAAIVTPASRDLANEVILLVEDEDAVRAAAMRALKRQGYRVLVASDGKEGLEVWRQHRDEIDLVLSDSMMPGMGGQALFAAIREERAEVRMLLMSGYSGDNMNPGITSSDEIPFLSKPWTVGELVSRVRDVLTPAESHSTA